MSTVTSPVHEMPATLGAAVASGARNLREVTITVQNVVPSHVDLEDRSVKHCYAQARPNYLLGYLMSPKRLYESMKRIGRAEPTMQATLNKWLANIRKQCGITWGDGLMRELLDGEERWLIWLEESERKEDIYTVELEEIAGFQRLLGACVDPALIIYKHPKHYIC
ncbi:hypothetical protein EV714DRAFT_287491 [Schizophyllum commune]